MMAFLGNKFVVVTSKLLCHGHQNCKKFTFQVLQITKNDMKRDVLPNAINRTLQMKCVRMRNFLDEHHDSLDLHIGQLRQYAISPGGMVLSLLAQTCRDR